MSQTSIALRFLASEHDFLSESDRQLLKRAADELERMDGFAQAHCWHYSRTCHTGGWSCKDCGASGPVVTP